MLTIHVHKGAGSGKTAIVLDTPADAQYDPRLEAHLIYKVLTDILPAATYLALAEEFQDEDFKDDDDNDELLATILLSKTDYGAKND